MVKNVCEFLANWGLGINNERRGVEGKLRGTMGQGQFLQEPAVSAYFLIEITLQHGHARAKSER